MDLASPTTTSWVSLAYVPPDLVPALVWLQTSRSHAALACWGGCCWAPWILNTKRPPDTPDRSWKSGLGGVTLHSSGFRSQPLQLVGLSRNLLLGHGGLC